MSASSTSKRTPPDRNFDNYILTRRVGSGVGLTDVPEGRFIRDPSISAQGLARSGGLFPIGFDFVFDGVTYKNAYITTSW